MTSVVRMTDRPTFLSLFSGCGGFDLGFELAGFDCLGAFDIDPLTVEVHQNALRSPSAVCDLSTVSRLDCQRRPDVVIAGPPCQGFSTLGKREPKDPRNSLVVSAANLAIAHRPKVVVIENVSGATTGILARYWNQAQYLLQASGYRTATKHLVSANFGVPQIRRRAVLIAWRGNRDEPKFETQSTTTLSDVLKDICGINHEPKCLKPGTTEHSIALRIKPNQKLCNVRGGDRAVATWEIPHVFGKTRAHERGVLIAIQKLRRQLRRRDSGDADPLLVREVSEFCGRDVSRCVRSLHERGYLRKLGQRFDLAHTFNGKYRRLAWDQLAPAVDTRFGEPRYFLHPEEHRGLSVREAARIQGFPDDFEFSGPRSAQFRMVGNAVPPPLARQIAIAIRDQLL